MKFRPIAVGLTLFLLFMGASAFCWAVEEPKVVNIRERPVANPEIPAFLDLEVYGVDFEFEGDVYFTNAYLEVSRDGVLLESYGRGSFSSGSDPNQAGSLALVVGECDEASCPYEDDPHRAFLLNEMTSGETSTGGNHQGRSHAKYHIPETLLDPIPDDEGIGLSVSFSHQNTAADGSSPAQLFELKYYDYERKQKREDGLGWEISKENRHEVVITGFLEFGKEKSSEPKVAMTQRTP